MTPYFVPPSIEICHVNRIIDGDTLECDKLKIRLCGADAPEKSQHYGAAATAKLTQLILNKNVRLISKSTDIYGRILSEVWLNNRFINAELIRSGLAYTYGTCPTQKTVLEDAQKSALANKFGVWKSEQIKPWIYRKRNK
jgi:micrococcal nuclease